MTTFTNNDVSDGAVIQSTDHNEQGSRVATVLNGGIDNNNIATGAAIAGSKLASSSVSNSQIDFGGSGNGVWWEEVARTTLGSTGDTITVSSIPARKYLKVLVYLLPTAGTIDLSLRLNNDSATNYARRVSVNGGADSTSVSGSYIVMTGAGATLKFGEFHLFNLATEEKLLTGHVNQHSAAGAANAPDRSEWNGKWANTADQISRIDVINNAGTGDFNTGSEVIVLGHN